MNQDFLKIALEAAKKAEEVILYYFGSVNSRLKQDKSPVTIADKEAEKLIINTIRSKFPNHSFLGEEFGLEKEKTEFLWIIDPIDGTKNYLRKIPLFATQIALMKNDELVLGVSNAPVFKELMYAEKGKGAYLNNEKIEVSDVGRLKKAYMSFGGIEYFEKNQNLSGLLSLIHLTQGHRGIGDFWSYHLLAQGKIDIMIEAQTKLWDIAAQKVIVEEAGGVITSISGKPIEKNTTSIIATNKKLHKEVLKYFL